MKKMLLPYSKIINSCKLQNFISNIHFHVEMSIDVENTKIRSCIFITLCDYALLCSKSWQPRRQASGPSSIFVIHGLDRALHASHVRVPALPTQTTSEAQLASITSPAIDCCSNAGEQSPGRQLSTKPGKHTCRCRTGGATRETSGIS